MTVPQGLPPLTPLPGSALPDFERAKVSSSVIKLIGSCEIDTYDSTVVSLDDRVRAVGEFRVVAVRHTVDKRTGEVVREQLLTPVDHLQVVPWDPSDPSDNGIVQARP